MRRGRRFPVNEVLQKKYRLELRALRLEEENRGYGDTEEGQLQRKINELELEKLRDGLEKMEALLENDGVVTAQHCATSVGMGRYRALMRTHVRDRAQYMRRL